MSSSRVKLTMTDYGFAKLLGRMREAAQGASVTVGIHAQEGETLHDADPTRGVTRDAAGRAHLAGKFVSKKKVAELEARAAKQRGSGKTSSVTVLDVGYWNEFGLGVPERSFIRAWFDETTEENRNSLRRAMKLVLTGDKTMTEALSLCGLKFVGRIQRRMAAGIEPPNNPETIRRKGSSKPLIDTGQLRASITYSLPGKR